MLLNENRRILVVDDEANIRQGYREALNPKSVQTFQSSHSASTALVKSKPELPYEITEAESGDQAYEILKDQFQAGIQFAGAIVDVRMPGNRDGLQFIQAAWKIDPNLLIVVATAYQDRSVNEIDRLFSEEFQDHWDYLNKPFTSGEIIQKARQLVSSWNRRAREKKYLAQIQEQQNTLIGQERLAAVGRLARSVGHEFGNILQPVLTQLESAKELVQSGEFKRLDEKIDHLIESVQLGARISQDLLIFSRETHESFQEHEKSRSLPSVKIAEPIQKALRLLSHEIKSKDIQLKLNIHEKYETHGNEARFVQVFINLFLNAIQAMKDGGKLEISISSNNGKLLITVQDQGCGIPAENMKNLFAPLFTTKGSLGNGLGLTVCKQIVQEYGGEIQIQSVLNEGTQVQITFPEAVES